MESVHVERLDHLGVIASVIKDLELIEMINARLVPDAQEVLTPGEAMAGMILNGLGFANRPLSLTPQFFANKPLELLFREGIRAEMLNRFKLGRTLDEAYTYGCDRCFMSWPWWSAPKKVLTCASIISTPPALRSTGSTFPTAMSRRLRSRMATPKITGRTSSKRSWN